VTVLALLFLTLTDLSNSGARAIGFSGANGIDCSPLPVLAA